MKSIVSAWLILWGWSSLAVAQRPSQSRTQSRGWAVRVARSALRTPAYADGRVFLGGGLGSREFMAFDARTGREVWRTSVSDNGPTTALVHQGRVVFGSESCHVHVLDAETGSIVWERYLGDPLTAAPSIGDGLVFAAYWDNHTWALAALDLNTGQPRWHRHLSANVLDAPVYDRGKLYLSLANGTVETRDARNGRRIWSREAGAIGAPTRVGSELRVVTGARRPQGVALTLRGFEAGRRATVEMLTGRLDRVARCAWREPLRLPLQLRAGRIAIDLSGVRGASRQCLSESFAGLKIAGNVNAVHELRMNRGAQSVSRLAFDGGRLLGKFDEVPIGHTSSLTQLWEYEGPRVVADNRQQIEVLGDLVRVRDLRSATGANTLRWTHRASHGATLPALAGPHIVFGDGSAVVVRRRDSGAVVAERPAAGRLASQPIIADGWVFASTHDGWLVGEPIAELKNHTYAMWGGNAARQGHNGERD